MGYSSKIWVHNINVSGQAVFKMTNAGLYDEEVINTIIGDPLTAAQSREGFYFTL